MNRICCPTSLWLLLSLGLACGCSVDERPPETVPIRGKVSYKGKPLSKGTIVFRSDRGQTAVGEIQPDGTFRLGTFANNDGATLGHHRISIIAKDFNPSLMPGTSPGYSPPAELLPGKYNQPDTSGLEAEVSKEKTELEFDLKE
jgi:hypothetical protein